MTALARHWPTLLWAVLLMLPLRAFAQTTLSEAQAKAAFVLNFSRYIEWPERVFASGETPLLICVLGRDATGSAVAALEGRQTQARAVAVRRLASFEEARNCQVLFITDSEERRLAMTLRGVAGQPVLTVSDIDGFIDMGGAIGIVHGDGRLQFEVNRQALEQAQLKASSHLLKLARNLADFKGRN
jgi:hypothetical protein